MFDFSKLSPADRDYLLRILQERTDRQLHYMNQDLKFWEADGSINSAPGKEMVGWRNALDTLSKEIAKERKPK